MANPEGWNRVYLGTGGCGESIHVLQCPACFCLIPESPWTWDDEHHAWYKHQQYHRGLARSILLTSGCSCGPEA